MHRSPNPNLARAGAILFASILFVFTGIAFAEENKTAPAQTADTAATQTPAKPEKLSGKYTRLVKAGDDTFAFELAVRTFRPAAGEGSEVRLISAIHIGSAEYYANLQKIIDAPKLLLFEGVSDDPAGAKKRSRSDEKTKDMYADIAHPLGLRTQSEALDYDRPNFKNADLSMTELREILRKEAEREDGNNAGGALLYFEQMEQLLRGNDPVAALMMRGVFGLIGNSPQLRAGLLFTLSRAEDDSATRQTPAAMQRLMRLILNDRNEAAMKILSEEISGKTPPATVGLFYGAAHMRGMERILVRKMNYRLVKTEWIRAFEIHPKAAGMSDETIEAITRGTVEKM